MCNLFKDSLEHFELKLNNILSEASKQTDYLSNDKGIAYFIKELKFKSAEIY